MTSGHSLQTWSLEPAHLPELVFPDARPNTMLAERTFWGKATAIHVYCRQERRRGERLSRHWHDLSRLDGAGIATSALADRELAYSVARHKAIFFSEKDARAACNRQNTGIPAAPARRTSGPYYGSCNLSRLPVAGVVPVVQTAASAPRTLCPGNEPALLISTCNFPSWLSRYHVVKRLTLFTSHRSSGRAVTLFSLTPVLRRSSFREFSIRATLRTHVTTTDAPQPARTLAVS